MKHGTPINENTNRCYTKIMSVTSAAFAHFIIVSSIILVKAKSLKKKDSLLAKKRFYYLYKYLT